MSEFRSTLERLAEDVEPSADALQRVARRRERLRRRRRVGTSVLSLAIAAGAIGVVSHAFLGHETRRRIDRTSVTSSKFDGGGVVLYAGPDGLGWAYADGTRQLFGRGYYEARALPGKPGGAMARLLASRLVNENNDYYLITGTGKTLRHVLPPHPPAPPLPAGYVDVQLSPDGRRLAYLRQISPGGPRSARYELYVLELRTGRRFDLGSVGPFTTLSPPVVWSDEPGALLLQADGGRAIEYVTVASGARGIQLNVTYPAVATPYDHAWPGKGPPSQILPLGWSPDPAVGGFAVLCSGPGGARPAVVVLHGRAAVGFRAPDGGTGLSFVWGSGGRFVLFSYSQTRAGRSGAIYLGTVTTGLRLLGNVVNVLGDPLISPSGTTVLIDEPRGTPSPTWLFLTVRGSHVQSTTVRGPGSPLQWTP